MEYESGSKTDKVELNKLLDIVKPGDTIVATEASRITKSIKQLVEIIKVARDKKLKLIFRNFILNCSNDELDPMAKAKAKGKQIGRPTTTIDSIPNIFLK